MKSISFYRKTFGRKSTGRTKEFLDELFKSGEIDGLKKGDVVKAKQKIHSAIQQEVQAETAVNQSLDKLDEALNTLGIE